VTPQPFWVELLATRHDRKRFDCGEPSLNDYLQRYARQNMNNDSARVYVAVQPDETRICDYFSLCAGHVDALSFPDRPRKGWPRDVPTALLGRLAVDGEFQRQGLGRRLVLAALDTTVQVADDIGVAAIDVWALNPRARAFYQKLGFLPLQDDPFHLYLATATARASLSQET